MNNIHKRFGALSSSQNPDELANRVKGTVLAFSSIIIYVAGRVFGIELGANDMVDIATLLGAVSGGIWAVYGAIIALVAKFAEKRGA